MATTTEAPPLTVWSTCAPGLEDLAKEEALETLSELGVRSVEASRGRLVCRLSPDSVDRLKRVLDLRIASNHFFIFHECPEDYRLAETKPAALDQLVDLVPGANWDLAMRVWRLFFHDPSGRHGAVASVGHEPLEGYCLSRANPMEAAEKADGTSKRPKDPSRLSFRCTCYRSGGPHAFQSMDAAATVGAAVQDYFGWNVDLKDYDVEVVLWIDGPSIRLCLSLNRLCMDFRGQLVSLGSTALRSTIAAGMLRMCHPVPGDVVCDCACGSGSVPLEAWTVYPGCWHLAGDCHPGAMDKTLANVEHWCQLGDGSCRPPVSLVRWDLRQFPLRPASVDVFLADLPFGKRMGSKRQNRDLYPAALAAMARCSVPGTGRACLLSADRSNLTRAVRLLRDQWTLTRGASVGIGGITASLVLLTRTLAPLT